MKSEVNLSNLSRSIIRTLAYYDIFSYPLTAHEIYYNLGDNHTNVEEIKNELKLLSSKQIVFNKADYFQLKNDEYFIRRRISGNELAEQKLITAHRVSSFISRFPFVRAVLLSGSISKGFMEKDSDIDYFIITHPNRVWFSRLSLMIFKKLILFNSKKNFCINYFVDSENLEIHEKNIFTATEVVTLLPTFSKDWYDKFYEKNLWIKNYYPNFPKRNTSEVLNRNDGMIKVSIEKILGKKLGDKLDDFAMSLFERFYKIRYRNYNTDEFKLAFKSSKKESKHHPKFFQKRVLVDFESKLKFLEKEYKISLNQ